MLSRRENFIKTFIERDIPALGIDIHSLNLKRLLKICAYNTGQLLNTSQIGTMLGITHHTVKKYINILNQTFVVRRLEPYYRNLGKRLVKTPKVYIRDVGLLHSFLDITNFDDLMAHPVFGMSWESLVVENVLTLLNDWQHSFYRDSNGNEVDLVLEHGKKRLLIECKASANISLTKGFWSSLELLKPDTAWIIAPVKDTYQIKENVFVGNISHFFKNYN